MTQCQTQPYKDILKLAFAFKEYTIGMSQEKHEITGYITQDGFLLINEFNESLEKCDTSIVSNESWYSFVSIEDFVKWTTWDEFDSSALFNKELGPKAKSVLRIIKRETDPKSWK